MRVGYLDPPVILAGGGLEGGTLPAGEVPLFEGGGPGREGLGFSEVYTQEQKHCNNVCS